MMDWSNHSWDIQFQSDRNDPKGLVNIGWFWSRPTVKTLDYYRTCRDRWLKQGGWDQAVMNNVLREIEWRRKGEGDSSIVRAIRLDPKHYVNYMLTQWYFALSPKKDDPTNVYHLSEEVRYEKILNASKATVMWHYTCVEKGLKSFLAKYYGQWADIDGYYTKERKFLSPVNIGYGISANQVVLFQLLRSIEWASVSGRTLIFPDIVYVRGDVRWPGMRVFSVAELELANVSFVEPTYLFNRETKHKIGRPNPTVLQVSSNNVSAALRVDLAQTELVVLDFNNTGAMNLSPSSIQQTKMIRLCKNRGAPAGCLSVCV